MALRFCRANGDEQDGNQHQEKMEESEKSEIPISHQSLEVRKIVLDQWAVDVNKDAQRKLNVGNGSRPVPNLVIQPRKISF